MANFAKPKFSPKADIGEYLFYVTKKLVICPLCNNGELDKWHVIKDYVVGILKGGEGYSYRIVGAKSYIQDIDCFLTETEARAVADLRNKQISETQQTA